MSRASLKIAFDGPLIHDGTMDVRDLAPALLAIGQLCEEANRVLNGERIQATILVRSDFQKGSFEVNLDLVQNLISQIKSLLAGEDATAAANLLAFISFGTPGVAGLFQLIKKLRGRRIRSMKIIESGNVRLEIDNEEIETTKEVISLYRDLSVRKAASDIVKPLEKNGIEKIEFRSPGHQTETITTDDAVYFKAPEPEEEQIIHEERKAAFTIVSISFKDGNKWRLHDGQNSILVKISDEKFINSVNNNETVFAKGDILVCRVLTEQWRAFDGLRTEYTILEVIEHQSAAKQLSLHFDLP